MIHVHPASVIIKGNVHDDVQPTGSGLSFFRKKPWIFNNIQEKVNIIESLNEGDRGWQQRRFYMYQY
jgi:hypothetical protein